MRLLQGLCALGWVGLLVGHLHRCAWLVLQVNQTLLLHKLLLGAPTKTYFHQLIAVVGMAVCCIYQALCYSHARLAALTGQHRLLSCLTPTWGCWCAAHLISHYVHSGLVSLAWGLFSAGVQSCVVSDGRVLPVLHLCLQAGAVAGQLGLMPPAVLPSLPASMPLVHASAPMAAPRGRAG